MTMAMIDFEGELALHPLCTLFPRLTGAEFAALKADIVANGQREPVVVHEGLVLDGGNRYQACMEAGIEPVLKEYAGTDPVAYVLSANLHRRHLTPGQQAAIVASAQDWTRAHGAGGDRKSDQTATLPLDSVADRAAQSGASERTQRMADKVAKASPELARQVAHGDISLPKALEQLAPKANVGAGAGRSSPAKGRQHDQAAWIPKDDLKTYTASEAEAEWGRASQGFKRSIMGRIDRASDDPMTGKTWIQLTPTERDLAHDALNADHYTSSWYTNKQGQRVDRIAMPAALQRSPEQVAREQAAQKWADMPFSERESMLYQHHVGQDAQQGKFVAFDQLGPDLRTALIKTLVSAMADSLSANPAEPGEIDDEDADLEPGQGGGSTPAVTAEADPFDQLLADYHALQAENAVLTQRIAVLTSDDLAAQVDELALKCAQFDSLATSRFNELTQLREVIDRQRSFLDSLRRAAGLPKGGDLATWIKHAAQRAA
jgi:ParB-like chromosome segregation protein Spo0J